MAGGRTLAALLGAALALSACGNYFGSDAKDRGLGTIGYVSGFFGGAATDEPRAALVARDVLSAGGSAADAATALYFALTVTKPSAASLGAFGACLVYQPSRATVRALDFMPRPNNAGGGGPDAVAVPAAPRAMFALHAAYGRLRWSQVVAPAEELARFGNPLSRSLEQDLTAERERIMADPAARAIFGRSTPGGGTVLATEGQVIEQLDLSSVLGLVRQRGPGDIYGGPFAHRFVAAVAEAGGTLSLDDLRDFRPDFGDPVTVPTGNNEAHFVPGRGTAGPMQAVLWAMLTQGGRLEGAPTPERLHLFAEAMARAQADAAHTTPTVGNLVERARVDGLMAGYDRNTHTPAARLSPAPVEHPVDDSGTGFVVVDRDGMAVACGLTMGRPFGLGRIARGTGIFPAVRPAPGTVSSAVSPMLVTNPNTDILILAAAGSGEGAATSVVNVAVRTVQGKEPLEQSVAFPRLHHPGAPDVLVLEREVGQEARKPLVDRGHDIREVDRLARLNAVYCADGLPDQPQTCSTRTDWRGQGLAAHPDM